jgi:hypothetical protein
MEETAAPGVAGPQPGVPDVWGSPADIVERWWADHFPGSPVARMTPAWNHAFAAKEELKRRLANLFGRV